MPMQNGILLRGGAAPEGAAGAGAPAGSPSWDLRIRRFHEELAAPRVSLPALARLAFHGVPDKDGLRATTWKLLLNYLPPERAQWAGELAKKRAEYRQFCEELIIHPAKLAAHDDHPLNQRDDSKWAAYFKDAEVLEQIRRDVMRTHPDMHFFSGDDGEAVRHRQEMERALFVYAKLNPGLTYVQGMNEVYAPLYFQFACDTDRGAAPHAEADAFFAFVELVAEFRDHFCQQLDNSGVGIRATMARLSSLLQQADGELWDHLINKNKVNPQFYAFRWITLLLTQEFPFPDTVRLWDTLLSDPAGRTDCLMRLCLAMVVNVRQELLQGDFASNLKLLQRYPPVDVHAILHRAQTLASAS